MESKSTYTEERSDFVVAREAVIAAFGVDVYAKNRTRNTVEGRMAYAYILRQIGKTLVEIGRDLKKDHTTIIHYMNSVKNLIETDASYARKYVKAREIFVLEKHPLNLLSDKDYKAENEVLEAKLAALTYEIRVLKAEKRELQFKLDMSDKKRLSNIFTIIERNTPHGFELVTERKIKKLFDV